MANAPKITTTAPLQEVLPKTTIPIPEPSTAAMIGLLGMALIFRKRK
ncbi:PEP-CTERM sorting domain-containing protein [Rubritalea spongiae]|uniref:PEP-CTERM sorting domain-containing protein n=1 Tax=Rubritalea spongiae TaxID=430797 RepID=A0ABW5E2H1_9BACT